MPVESSNLAAPGAYTWERKTGGLTTYGPVTTSSSYGTASSHYVVKPERRKKPAGWLHPLPYTFEKEVTSHVIGRLRRRFPGYDDYYKGHVASFLSGTSGGNMQPGGNTAEGHKFPTLGMLSLAETRALNALLTDGKVRDSVFSVGVAWRERKETANLLENTARRFVDMAGDFRRGKPMRAFNDLFPNGSRKDFDKLKGSAYWRWYKKNFDRRLTRGLTAAPALVASAILAVQNGWKPLLSDVHAAAEALAYRDDPADWVITAKGYVKDVQRVSQVEVPVGQPENELLAEWVNTRACFVRLDATVVDFVAHQWAQLGLNNPASLLYETTPLTYVADYFWDVGNWLSAMGATSGMKFFSGSSTRFGESVQTVRDNGQGPFTNFSGSRRWVRMERKALTGFPIPISPFEIKPEKLSMFQLANLASLFTLFVTGKPLGDTRQ